MPRVGSISDQRAVFSIDQVGSARSNSRMDTIRRMVITQTLRIGCQSLWTNKGLTWNERTYRSPNPKTVLKASLDRRGRCRFHTMRAGKQSTVTSVSRFIIPAAKYAAGRSAHFPSLMVGSQLNASGRQSRNSSKNTDKNQHTEMAMTQ